MHPAARSRAVEGGVEAGVDEQEAFAQLDAGEADAGELAYGAAAAVAADQPARPHGTPVAQHGGDAVGVLIGGDQGGAPLRCAAQLGQAVAQPRLDAGLGDHHRGSGGLHAGVAEPDAHDGAVAGVGGDRHRPDRLLGQAAERVEPVEHLGAARVDEVGPRRGGRGRGPVDHAYGDAVLQESTRQSQADRPGTHYENVGVHRHPLNN
ncbi:hypothetical protein GCM10020001_000560 [Nonomuraea salmonea]